MCRASSGPCDAARPQILYVRDPALVRARCQALDLLLLWIASELRAINGDPRRVAAVAEHLRDELAELVGDLGLVA